MLLKRHLRSSKYEPLVDEVNLLEANPQYAHVRFPDGREDTVSIKHLAPTGNEEALIDRVDQSDVVREEVGSPPIGVEIQTEETGNALNDEYQPQPLRRLERLRKAPDRLAYT